MWVDKDVYEAAKELALASYQDFSDGFSHSQLQHVWDEFQEQFGDIEIGSIADSLVIELITYGIITAINQDEG